MQYQDSEEGWGRLKAKATINKTSWKTSMWFDTKLDTYLLPIRKDIRKKEGLVEDTQIKVSIELERELI